MRRAFRIKKKDRARIEEAVAQAESRSSAEIVPVIVAASDDYRWVNWFWSFLFLITASAVLWWATSAAPWAEVTHRWLKDRTDYSFWSVTVQDAVMLQACAALFGFALGYLGIFRRIVIPSRQSAASAHRQALASFMAAGLTETKGRTGVLVFLSHFERRLEILADSGVNDKVSVGFWNGVGNRVIKGIHEGKVVDALVQVIEEIGDELARVAPRAPGDVDELPNALWTTAPTETEPPPPAPARSFAPPSQEDEDPAPISQPSAPFNSPLPPLKMTLPGEPEDDEPERENTKTSELDLSVLPEDPAGGGGPEPTIWDTEMTKWDVPALDDSDDPEKKKKG